MRIDCWHLMPDYAQRLMMERVRWFFTRRHDTPWHREVARAYLSDLREHRAVCGKLV